VRDVQFDLQMKTSEFVQLEPEFRHGGIVPLQMLRRVPDTLCVPELPARDRYRILRENVLHLEFHLPHAGEYASVASPRREVLERLVGDPRLAANELP
jgi:hypothetical protein